MIYPYSDENTLAIQSCGSAIFEGDAPGLRVLRRFSPEVVVEIDIGVLRALLMQAIDRWHPCLQLLVAILIIVALIG